MKPTLKSFGRLLPISLTLAREGGHATWLNNDHSDWLAGLRYGGNEELPLAILMPLLPNITTVSFGWGAWEDTVLIDMIKSVPSASNPSSRSLNAVRLTANNDIDDIRAFSALPALRSIIGIETFDYDGFLGNPMPVIESQVTHLALQNANVASITLDEILRGFCHLKSFVYEHQEHRGGDCRHQCIFDPFVLHSALLAYTSASLEQLILLGDSRRGTASFMGWLCGFKELGELTTE